MNNESLLLFLSNFLNPINIMMKLLGFLEYKQKYPILNPMKSIFMNLLDDFVTHTKSVYIEASEKCSTLLELTLELKDIFDELEFFHHLIFGNNEKTLDLEQCWEYWNSDIQIMNGLFSVSKKNENLDKDRKFLNFIAKKIFSPFINFLGDVVFRVK